MFALCSRAWWTGGREGCRSTSMPSLGVSVFRRRGGARLSPRRLPSRVAVPHGRGERYTGESGLHEEVRKAPPNVPTSSSARRASLPAAKQVKRRCAVERSLAASIVDDDEVFQISEFILRRSSNDLRGATSAFWWGADDDIIKKRRRRTTTARDSGNSSRVIGQRHLRVRLFLRAGAGSVVPPRPRDEGRTHVGLRA